MKNDFLEDFLTEANEHLSNIEDDILTLERIHPEPDEEIINRIFRAVHTIKGGAGFLELQQISKLAHYLEGVLGLVRDRKLILDTPIADVLLKGTDTLISLIENTTDSSISIDAEVAALETILKPFVIAVPESDQYNGHELPDCFDMTKYDFSISVENSHFLYLIEISVSKECGAKKRHGKEIIGQIESIGIFFDSSIPLSAISPKSATNVSPDTCLILFSSIIDDPTIIMVGADLTFITRALIQASDIPSFVKKCKSKLKKNRSKKNRSLSSEPHTAIPSDQSRSPAVSSKQSETHPHKEQTIRISLNLLDQIMNLAGELVLIRNQNTQAVASENMQKITSINKQLNMVTTELHTSIMRTRMRPVGGVFNRFNRVVRDLAKKLGKEVSLSITGSEVELDKTIIDGIADPLTHLIRNAVDHGLESPKERQKKGKPPTGTIHLQALHETGQVTIRIKEDGKGINPETLREAAVRKKLFSREQVEALSDSEVFELIFSPGFSTAETISDISGRGVGMDVVKASFQKIGGVVSIASKVDVGTTISIQLPLTLAILPSLIVTVEGLHFALPQANIDEVLWLHGSEVYQNIKEINQREVYRLKGKYYPLLHLSKLFNIPKTFIDPKTGKRRPERRRQLHDRRENDIDPQPSNRRASVRDRRTSLDNSIYIIVLKDGNDRFGLLVDTITDSEEIVVKPLHRQLKKYRHYSGNAVLGDGSIALILDIGAIAKLGGIQQCTTQNIPHRQHFGSEEVQNILLFTIGGSEQFAIPLNLITRVEAIAIDTIQIVKERPYIDFCGSILPLIYLEKAISSLKSSYPHDTVHIIIPRSLRPIGLVVSAILDTVSIACILDGTTIRHPGIVGTQLIDGNLTLFIDIFEIVEAVEPGWFSTESIPQQKGKRVLLVEDSNFYQAMLRSYLRGIGTEVQIAENGQEAITLLDKNRFDGIISDIEMPVMDGNTFARTVRKRSDIENVPLLAISSKDDNRSKEEAFDAGFDDFRTKFDIDGMLDTIQRLFSSTERHVTQP